MVKRTFRSRRTQRGAAVFLVVMAIMLLSAIGLWSMSSASMADQSSGFMRASVQSQAAAEFALTGAMTYLSLNATDAYRIAISKPDRCSQVATGAPCRQLLASDDLELLAQSSTTKSFVDTSTAGPGSFGFTDRPFAYMAVEITDFVDANKAGESAGGATAPVSFKRASVTSTARLRPGTTATACSAGENSAASRILVRSQTLIGPIYGTQQK